MLKFQDNHTSTLATFEDFILTVFVIFDDLYLKYAPNAVSKLDATSWTQKFANS